MTDSNPPREQQTPSADAERVCPRCRHEILAGASHCGCGYPARRRRLIKYALVGFAVAVLISVGAVVSITKNATDGGEPDGAPATQSKSKASPKKETTKEREAREARAIAAYEAPGAKSIPGGRLPRESALSGQERRALSLLRDAEAARRAMSLCVRKETQVACAADNALDPYLQAVAADPKTGPAIASAAKKVKVASGRDVNVTLTEANNEGEGYNVEDWTVTAYNPQLEMTYTLPSTDAGALNSISCEAEVQEGTAEAAEKDPDAGPLCKAGVVELPDPR